MAGVNLPPESQQPNNPSIADLMTAVINLQQQLVNQTQSHQPIESQKKLPDPERFGQDRSQYPTFETYLRAKLNVDSSIIGNETTKVYYAFGRLSGLAAEQMRPWVSTYSDTPFFTVGRFIEHMRSSFLDPELQSRAQSKLGYMKQNRRSIGEFLAEYDKTILEAGAVLWDDAAKIFPLKRAINQDIRQLLVTVNEPREYPAFCQVLKELERKKDEYSPKNYRRNPTPTAATPGPQVPVSSWEPNDVEMTMGNIQQPRPAVRKMRAK